MDKSDCADTVASRARHIDANDSVSIACLTAFACVLEYGITTPSFVTARWVAPDGAKRASSLCRPRCEAFGAWWPSCNGSGNGIGSGSGSGFNAGTGINAAGDGIGTGTFGTAGDGDVGVDISVGTRILESVLA